MKIIHLVLGKANPERMNGVNKVAYQLAKTQTDLGYEVKLWGIAKSLDHNYPPRNFQTELFKQKANKFSLDPKLTRAIKRISINTVVHIHGAFIPEFYLISRYLKTLNIPYIYTPHGSLTEMAMTKNRFAKKIYFSYFESKLIQDAKWVQLLGINEYKYLDKLTDKANKCLIPNGQDLEEIPQLSSAKGAHPVFGFCGRLARFHKGLDLMLKGFQIYLQQGGKARLELIGDGADRAALEKLAKSLGIADAVCFHGKKFGEEKFALLSRMDVFLHSSRMEGFPTAVLEAAAMSKPTITSEATNINSFVRKYQAGLAMKENTPEEIAESMNTMAKLFYGNKLETIGQQARKMVQTEFNWNPIATRLVEMYSN